MYADGPAATSNTQGRQMLSGVRPELLIVRGLAAVDQEWLLSVADTMGVRARAGHHACH